MLLPALRELARRAGVVGLVALALLLPLAQTLGAAHALSHPLSHATTGPAGSAGGDSGGSGDAAPIADAHCDLCLAFSAVDGGSLLPSLPLLPAGETALQAVASPRAPARAAAPCAAYLSRAPPSSIG